MNDNHIPHIPKTGTGSHMMEDLQNRNLKSDFLFL